MLDNIIFVLYQPQDVANVGGVARALSNFGLRRLRLVEPAAFDAGRVAGIAHQAEAVIAGIERFPDLPAALADCGLVAATTGRVRRVRYTRQTPRDAAPALLAAAQPAAPVAILFGREDTGLPNDALSSAHLLVTIPTDPANHSLNLAQAALVLAYELWLAAQAAPPAPAAPPPALGAHREAMFAALERLLAGPGGRPAAHLAHDMEILRAVLLRAAPRAAEATRLTDLFRRLARTSDQTSEIRRQESDITDLASGVDERAE
jgi:tRNA/rRNA methyltransferase/tRNA (cytidine32/uridine32-2'-O)-methyltransferase